MKKMPEYPKLMVSKLKYPSPSGFVNVGKYIPPFAKVENGFGYMGVLVEDFKSGKIQCHICGEWLKQFAMHLSHKHKMTSAEYKIKFGLSSSTALKSKKMRLEQSKIMQKSRRKYKQCNFSFAPNNSYAGNRKGKSKSLETKNKYGVCDLQIAHRVLKLKKELNKTPTLTQLKERYGNTFITLIHSRYSRYIQLCNKLGIKAGTSNYNPKYSKAYFIKKGLSNEPAIRILTINEGRALYRHFKGVKEWRKAVECFIKENKK